MHTTRACKLAGSVANYVREQLVSVMSDIDEMQNPVAE
jgi:hypothetical protein